MVETIYIYYEGDRKLQPGFRKFLDSLYQQGVKIRLVSTGGNPIADFVTGMKSNSNAVNILLKDSEGSTIQEALDQVKSHDHWDTGLASQVADDQLHFMVQVMESWFLADRVSLHRFYGRGFSENRLPGNLKIEEIPKDDVLRCLAAATEKTQKGKYHKTMHAPDLLARIDAARVRAAAPACERLFYVLEHRTA